LEIHHDAPEAQPHFLGKPLLSVAKFRPEINRPYLAKNLLLEAQVSLLVGPPNIGKSSVVAALAASISTGRALGKIAVKRGVVLYVAAEDRNGVAERGYGFFQTHAADIADFEIHGSPVDLTDEGEMKRFAGEAAIFARERRAERMLIVFDTLNLCIGDGDENSSRDTVWNAARDRQERLTKVRGQRVAHDANGLSASQSLRRRKFLLSGLLRCGICGGSLTVAGSGEAKRYYCANAKEKGKSVCQGMPGLPVRQAEEHVIDQLRDHLMKDAAFASFKTSFLRGWSANKHISEDVQRIKEKTIARLEKERAGLLAAIKRGFAEDELLKELEQVGKDLERAKVKREAAKPVDVPLPHNLPEQYRAYVDDLVATMNDEGIVSRASDLLHDMIDQVIVRYDGTANAFDVEIDGNIVKMLMAINPAGGGAYARMGSSIILVAGTGFEPVTFRL
jgi:hypothetical protein